MTVVPAGGLTDQPAITMDWTATILTAAATQPDKSHPLDGDDLMPVCTGARPMYERTLFWRTRTRDAARHGRWKYLKDSGIERLFDLSTDPGEKTDLKAKQPGVFAELKKLHTAWDGTLLPRP